MPRLVNHWPDDLRTAVYKAMVAVDYNYFADKDRGPWLVSGGLHHTKRLGEIFQTAQLKAKVPKDKLRERISGSTEIAKMERVIKRESASYRVRQLAKDFPKTGKVEISVGTKLIEPVAYKTVKRADVHKANGTYAPGYHLKPIPKGELGELSKVQEELNEALDAAEQGVKLMVLQELSDMVGAVEAYLDKHFPDLTFLDLQKMAAVTKRAFKNGRRS